MVPRVPVSSASSQQRALTRKTAGGCLQLSTGRWAQQVSLPILPLWEEETVAQGGHEDTQLLIYQYRSSDGTFWDM